MFVNFLQTRSLLNDLPAIFGHAPDEMVEGDSMWWVGAGRWMQQYSGLEGGHLKSIAALINLLLNPNPNPTHEKLDPRHQHMGVKISPCYLATVRLPHLHVEAMWSSKDLHPPPPRPSLNHCSVSCLHLSFIPFSHQQVKLVL